MALRQIKFSALLMLASAPVAWASDDFGKRVAACEQLIRDSHNPDRFANVDRCLAPLVGETKRDDTKSELLYRRAEMMERGEHFAEARAAFLALAQQYPREHMAARARFRAARLLEDDLGDPAGALAEYRVLIHEAPDSPAAVNALVHAEALLPDPTAMLSAELQSRPHSALSLTLMRHLALHLSPSESAELLDRVAAAEPAGAPRITATYAAARAWLAAGDVESALSRLRVVVASHEGSILPGDTNSAALDDAALLIAQIYRDRLHDMPRAKEAFERVVHDYPDSRLVDDALHALQQLALEAGDRVGAAKALARLQKVRPTSRYATP